MRNENRKQKNVNKHNYHVFSIPILSEVNNPSSCKFNDWSKVEVRGLRPEVSEISLSSLDVKEATVDWIINHFGSLTPELSIQTGSKKIFFFNFATIRTKHWKVKRSRKVARNAIFISLIDFQQSRFLFGDAQKVASTRMIWTFLT